MGLWFLDIVQYTLSMRVGYNAAKVGGSVVVHSRSQNDSFGILLFKQLQHFPQGERAANVGIQNKYALGIALENRVTEVVEAAGSSQRSIFTKVLDSELGKLLDGVLDEVSEDGFVIVADQNDFSNIWDLRKGFEAVTNDGVAGDIEKGLNCNPMLADLQTEEGQSTNLWNIKGQRPKASSS